LGYKELVKTVKDLIAAGDSEFTKLRPDLTGIDPDDAFSIVPYEKGCLFLFFLELKVGGKEKFMEWLNSFYFKYKMQSISTEILKEHFLNFFADKKEALAQINWDQWMNEPGLPQFDPSKDLANKFSTECDVLVAKWLHSLDGSDLSEQDLARFKPTQIMYCLDEVVANGLPFKHKVLDGMEQHYKFFSSNNVEIANRFIGLGLRSKYPPAVPIAAKFLAAHGRGRYVKYLYNCLNDYDHSAAVGVFKENRHRYHSVIQNAFDGKLSK